MPANTGDQAAADLLRKRYRRYLEASGILDALRDGERLTVDRSRGVVTSESGA
jgi:hypothetical protein